MSFTDLGLSEKVQQAVAAAGYNTPTPIQQTAIPHVLQRRDVLGIAQTGTGKTAAFTLPMLTLLEHGRARARMPRTLILEPTRELAAQVEESFEKYGTNHKLSVALLIGGVSFGDQDAKITRGVDVLIATPGRLLDHFERGKLLLTGIEILVIDEADRMLDMGFIPDIERICRLVPFTRQTLFFSATMPPEIQRLTDTFLHNPVKVEVARAASTAATITQRLVASGSEQHHKRETLRRLIRSAGDELQNAIIFCNRKRDVAIVLRSLERHGFNVVALHGDMDQRSRMQALDSFRNGTIKLLVASDVAARGLDIPAVSHVFNYDVPHHAEDYVHRIGRTGRAGRTGYATTIVAPGDEKSLAAIEALTGQTVAWEGPTLGEFIASVGHAPQEDGDRHRGRRGGRDRERDRDRGRGRGERSRAAEAAPQQHAPITPDGRPSQRHEERRGDRQHQQRRYADRDDEMVVGFGEHVPSFILRPVVIPVSSDDEGTAAPVVEETAVPVETASEAKAERTSGRRRRGRRHDRPAAAEAAQPVEVPAAAAPEAPGKAEELAPPVTEVVAPEEAPAPRKAASRRTAKEEPAAEADPAGKTRKRAPRKAAATPDVADEQPAPKKRARKATTEPAAEAEAAAPAPSKAASRKSSRKGAAEAVTAEAPAQPSRTPRRKKADAEAPTEAAKPKKAAPRKAADGEAASEAAPAGKTASRKAPVARSTGVKKAASKKPAAKKPAARKPASKDAEAPAGKPAARKPRSRKAEVVEAGD